MTEPDEFPTEDPFYYDPWDDPQPEPHPVEFYVGTGIAALYGGPMTAAQALELAGWTIADKIPEKPRRKDPWDSSGGPPRLPTASHLATNYWSTRQGPLD